MDKQTIFLGFFIALLATLPAASAFAASSYSITVAPSASTYYQGQTVTISGKVSPVPPAGTTVTLKVVGPTGGVYIDSVNPSSTTGAYSFSFVLLPKSNWPAGKYSVNVTWAESYQGPFASNTTSFTVLSAPVPVTPTVSPYTVKAYTSTPLLPGQNLEVEALAMWSNGSPVTSASFPVAEFVTPSGSIESLGSPTQINKGVYLWTMAVPSSASTGVYSVILEANVSSVTEWVTTSYTVNSGIASESDLLSLNSSVSGISSSLSSLSGTMTTQYSSVMSSLASISTMISDLKTSVSSDYSSLSSAISSMSSTVSTISSTTSSLSSVGTSVSSLQSSVSSLESTVSSLSTYLLVVAVLAIIIIVLELVLLVRKR
ncbi:MAG: hypothetical protein ACP5GS_07800 [Nitrososphaeria archaeon]